MDRGVPEPFSFSSLDAPNDMFSIAWVDWARSRILELETKLNDTKAEIAPLQVALANTKEQLSVAEKYVNYVRQRRIKMLEPGAEVKMVRISSLVRGTVEQVLIGNDKTVRYNVAYWLHGRRYNVWVSPDEISDDHLPIPK